MTDEFIPEGVRHVLKLDEPGAEIIEELLAMVGRSFTLAGVRVDVDGTRSITLESERQGPITPVELASRGMSE